MSFGIEEEIKFSSMKVNTQYYYQLSFIIRY